MKRQYIRRLALPGFELGDYIAEAVDFLRQHEPLDGFFVGFSGGKDSIVALHLCKLAGVRHQAFYSCTRIDPPEMYQFIRLHYPDVGWLYPKESVYTTICQKFPPLRMHRWCCDALKKEPAKNHPLKHRVMGLRAEESVRRASRPRVDSFFGQTTYKAIFRWPEWAVWEAIDAWALPYPRLYDEGFNRIGCVVCPYLLGTSPGAVRQREMSQQRWPGIWKAYKHAVVRWWNAKRAEKPALERRHDNADDYWRDYLLGFEGCK